MPTLRYAYPYALQLELDVAQIHIDEAYLEIVGLCALNEPPVFAGRQNRFHANRLMNTNRCFEPLLNALHRCKICRLQAQMLGCPQAHGQKVTVDYPDGAIKAGDIAVPISSTLATTIWAGNDPKAWPSSPRNSQAYTSRPSALFSALARLPSHA